MTYPSIAAIQAAVCAHFRVTHLDLLSRRRGRAISRPRQVGMWLARHTTPLSLPEIGREFQRDHTTVMHAVDRIDREIAAITPHGAIALQLRTALEQGEAA
jgi:chromosomal replication initiator protein